MISPRALPSKQMSANLTVKQALSGLKALLLILIGIYEVVLLYSGLLAKFVSEHWVKTIGPECFLVVLSHCHSVDKIRTCDHSHSATEQFFPCVIFTMLIQVEFSDLKVLVMFVSQYF